MIPMRKSHASLFAALAVAVSFGAAGIAAPGPAVAGAPLWVQRYDGPGGRWDGASSVVVSPGGSRVFVTGASTGSGSGEDYATVAYSAVTGARLWVQRYDGPAGLSDRASSVAVSPGGDRVFVTGSSAGSGSGLDYATVAYSAVTGARLWASRYNGPGNGEDSAISVQVSPGGSMVFVTGASTGSQGYDYATIGYDAATGARLWVARYEGPGKDLDAGHALAVTASTVFVTGQSTGAGSGEDYATVAYDAATGAQLWARRYNGPGNSIDSGNAVKASPAGDVVFVTGFSPGAASQNDYATIAYDAVTGTELWVQRYNGPAGGSDDASSLAISRTGATVFVTGQSPGATTSADYVTVAYDAASGTRLWARRYNGPASSVDVASSVTVNPAGTRVYVTGFSVSATSQEDYATVAYNAATGTQLWVRRYNGPGNWTDRANSIAVSPSAATVFVTGYSAGTTRRYDYATAAYRG